jgi:sugar transferase (PEP-CTERM/EpsH1 system associated)
MKVLFLTSRFPYPPYRGDKLKIYNLIRRLSTSHEITLLSFVESSAEMAFVDELRPYCVRVEVVHLPRWRSYIGCAAAILSSLPLQVAYFTSGEMSERLEQLLGEESFDVMHVHLIRMAQYASTRRSMPPRVLDLTDAGSLYLRRFLGQTRSIVKKIVLTLELQRLERYEHVLESFELSLVCSPVDQGVLLRAAPKADVRLLYNGVDLDYFSSNGSEVPEEHSLIFTGNMSYFPNIDGAEYLVKEIMPLVWSRYPHANASLVGQSPPSSVRRLAGENVLVTGFAQDIRQSYLRNSIALAPVRFGAGTLNKVLEPMALGRPVVASSVAVEGLPAENGVHLLVADTPQDFARAITRLFEDASLRASIAREGQQLVRSRFDWDRIVGDLRSYYAHVAGVHH